jgi:hypothetical protein
MAFVSGTHAAPPTTAQREKPMHDDILLMKKARI